MSQAATAFVVQKSTIKLKLTVKVPLHATLLQTYQHTRPRLVVIDSVVVGAGIHSKDEFRPGIAFGTVYSNVPKTN